MKKLLWFILITLALYLGVQDCIFRLNTHPGHSVVELELSRTLHGEDILQAWQATPYGAGTLLDLIKNNTHWDFLFIACYVLLMVWESQYQMQKESNYNLNQLLRLNLLLALLTGILDLAENLFMLHNFRHVSDHRYYIETVWVSAPKFLFSFWILAIWLISLFKSRRKRQQYRKSTSYQAEIPQPFNAVVAEDKS